MPQAIPIQDLKDTAKASQMRSESREPIHVAKGGYGGMVMMSVQACEELLDMADICAKLDAAEEGIRRGRTSDAAESLKSLRAKLVHS